MFSFKYFPQAEFQSFKLKSKEIFFLMLPLRNHKFVEFAYKINTLSDENDDVKIVCILMKK